MQIELQEKLFNKYPKLFRQKDMSMKETCMCWGINCGDGWYSLIDTACGAISNIDYDTKPNTCFVQIKEKYGTLRMYTNATDGFTNGIIHMAEYMSAKICENCGSTKNVTMCNNGWLSVRCKKCRDKEESFMRELGYFILIIKRKIRNNIKKLFKMIRGE